MNQTPTLDDLKLSTSILNFLAGGFQGIISCHTVLNKLNHPMFSEQEMLGAEKIMGKIADSLVETYNGNPTFYCSWTEVDSFEAANFIDALEKLRTSLKTASNQLKEFFKTDSPEPSHEQVEVIFAYLARRLLGTDSYLQEQYRIASAIGDEAQMNSEALLMNALSFELDELTVLGDKIFEKKVSSEDISLLKKRTKDLSFIFAAQAHECRVLSRTYESSSSFSAFDIEEEEADKWSSQSIDPVTAGYFIAYGLDIEDMVAWTDAQFYDALEIFSWKNSGFLPHVAATWRSAGFMAEEAIPWMRAEYKPEAARTEIDKGIDTPKRSASFTTKISAPKSSPHRPAEYLASRDTKSNSPKQTKVADKPSGAAPQIQKETKELIEQHTSDKLTEQTGKADSPSALKESIPNSPHLARNTGKSPFKTRNTFTIKKNRP